MTVLPALQRESGPAYVAPEVMMTTKGQTFDEKVCRRGWLPAVALICPPARLVG